MAREHVRWKRGLCSSCRSHEDWWDEDKGGDRDAMIAESHRCLGCERVEQMRESVPREAKGVTVHLVPNPARNEGA